MTRPMYPVSQPYLESEAEAVQVLEWLTAGRRPRVPPSAEDVPTRTINFEPTVISVSPERRATILRRAGWRQVSTQFLIRDFERNPLDNHVCFLQFIGPRGEYANERANVEGGVLTFSNHWIKPDGTLRLMCVPIAHTPAEAGPLLEGPVPVPRQITRSYLVLNAVQDHDDVTLTASSQEQVASQLQAQGSVKFNILDVAEIGGGGGGSRTTTTGTGATRTWQVRIGRPSLTITEAR